MGCEIQHWKLDGGLMVTQNSQNNRWQIIEETAPSGVTNVVHTGTEAYDWILAEYAEVETSSSGYVTIRIGQTAIPTYRLNTYIVLNNAIRNVLDNADIYQQGIAPQTTDRRHAILIANMGRKFDNASALMKIPFSGGGWTDTTNRIGGTNGYLVGYQQPITAIQYLSSAGNLQGAGAVIRTWGYR